jgi:hypothetical protein
MFKGIKYKNRITVPPFSFSTSSVKSTLKAALITNGGEVQKRVY